MPNHKIISESILNQKYAENGKTFDCEPKAMQFLKSLGYSKKDKQWKNKQGKQAWLYLLRDLKPYAESPFAAKDYIRIGYLVSFGGKPKFL